MRKILGLVVVVCMVMFSVLPAKADHYNPSGGKCNNTYYSLSHVAQTQAYGTQHNTSCMIANYVWSHNKYCSSCGAYLSSGPTYLCTQIHSQCGGSVYDCIGVFAQ